jgi:tRNA U34 5-carboxymethylaminomethyl modifying GTPase MnmE/TrmE
MKAKNETQDTKITTSLEQPKFYDDDDIFALYNNLLTDTIAYCNENTIEFLRLELDVEIQLLSNLERELLYFEKGSMLNDLYNNINLKVFELINLESSLDKPFLLFIIGMGKYGKSTLINALLEVEYAEVGVLPKTWKIDVFEKSDSVAAVKVKLNDSETLSFSESDARDYLHNEEQKREASEKEINELFIQNTLELKTIEEKEEYKVYLEKKHLYHSPVREVTWQINKNNFVLNNFRLVDTPGLVQDFSGGLKEGLSDYYYKADGIVWILDATTISAKKNQELIMEFMSNSADNKRIRNSVAVLNRADVVYQQKGGKGVERILEQAYELYGTVFPLIIPISAKSALDGILTNDQPLIEASNIDELRAYIRDSFYQGSKQIRYQSKSQGIILLKEKTHSFCKDYNRRLMEDSTFLLKMRGEITQKAKDLEMTLLTKYKSTFSKYLSGIKKRVIEKLPNLNDVNQIPTNEFDKYISEKIIGSAELKSIYIQLAQEAEKQIQQFYNYQLMISAITEFKHLKLTRRQPIKKITLSMPTSGIETSQSSQQVGNSLGAGALGAIAGSLIAPGIGTVAGVIIGGVIGWMMSETDEIKLEKIHVKINGNAEQMIKNVKESLSELVKTNILLVVSDIKRQQEASFANVHCRYMHVPKLNKLLKEFAKPKQTEEINLYQIFLQNIFTSCCNDKN